ncbi:MAG: MATE family efflux transporter [Bacillota bacterium]
MAKTKNYEINMTDGNLFIKIFKFSIPLIITGVLQLLYTAVDMIVVGKFAGAAALSAVGSTTALVNMIINIFMGLSVGVGVCISRYYGAKDYDSMEKTIHTAIALAIIGGIFLACISRFILEPILVAMSTPTEVLTNALLYLQILFLGMPFNLIYNFGAAMLRATGDTQRPLKFLASAGVVNVIFNLIFVIVFDMGVAGVAIATIISQFLSSSMVMISMMKGKGILKFEIKKLKIHKTQFKKIVRIGLPAGIQASLFSISNVMVQSSINSFNSTIITAGNAASTSLEGFMYVATNSVTQAAMTASGQNMGAGEYSRVKKGAGISVLMSIIVSTVLGVFFIIFSENLVALYSDGDIEVIAVGVQRLKYMATFYVACALMDVMVGQLKGMGYYIFPTIVSFCGVCVFRIFWVSVVFAIYPTLDTIFLVYPISWSITAFMQLIILVVAMKKLPKSKSQLMKV